MVYIWFMVYIWYHGPPANARVHKHRRVVPRAADVVRELALHKAQVPSVTAPHDALSEHMLYERAVEAHVVRSVGDNEAVVGARAIGPSAGFFWGGNISEHAEGQCPSEGTYRRVSPRPFRRHPPIRSSPSVFAVGVRRKAAKNRPALGAESAPHARNVLLMRTAMVSAPQPQVIHEDVRLVDDDHGVDGW